MGNRTLLPPHSFCWNASCSAYGQVDLGTIRKFGRTPGGVQRYHCRLCRRTFVETIGTVFYRRRRSQQTSSECLALLAERNSLAAIHPVKGVKEQTVMAWLHIAAAHVERTCALLRANYKLSRAQLDAMWVYVGTKGEKGARLKPTNLAPSGAA